MGGEHVIHTYKVSKVNRNNTIYEFVKSSGEIQLTHFIKVYSNVSKKVLADMIKMAPPFNNNQEQIIYLNNFYTYPDYPACFKSDLIVGLMPSRIENMYYGHCSNVKTIGNTTKTLLIVKFIPAKNLLMFVIYKNIYPEDSLFRDFVIKTHSHY